MLVIMFCLGIAFRANAQMPPENPAPLDINSPNPALTVSRITCMRLSLQMIPTMDAAGRYKTRRFALGFCQE
jgi:hypothetical protein